MHADPWRVIRTDHGSPVVRYTTKCKDKNQKQTPIKIVALPTMPPSCPEKDKICFF